MALVKNIYFFLFFNIYFFSAPVFGAPSTCLYCLCPGRTISKESDHHPAEDATTTTSGSFRLCRRYSWSLANHLLRLRTLMCIIFVIAKHNAVSACVRPWLGRYVTRWSLCSGSSDIATLNDVSCNDLINYTIVLFSRDLKLIILLSRENKVLLSQDLKKIIQLFWENGGNKIYECIAI